MRIMQWDGDKMDILITCIVYILLVGSLLYFIWEEMGVKKRKKLNVLEVHFERGTAFVAWTICFIFGTLFTIDNYLMFLHSVNREIPYFILPISLSSLLSIGYYMERWKVIIDDDKIIKYSMFSKRVYNICDITKIKRTWWSDEKYYVNRKKIFSTSSRYHDYSITFERYIRENSNIKE